MAVAVAVAVVVFIVSFSIPDMLLPMKFATTFEFLVSSTQTHTHTHKSSSYLIDLFGVIISSCSIHFTGRVNVNIWPLTASVFNLTYSIHPKLVSLFKLKPTHVNVNQIVSLSLSYTCSTADTHRLLGQVLRDLNKSFKGRNKVRILSIWSILSHSHSHSYLS